MGEQKYEKTKKRVMFLSGGSLWDRPGLPQPGGSSDLKDKMNTAMREDDKYSRRSSWSTMRRLIDSSAKTKFGCGGSEMGCDKRGK